MSLKVLNLKIVRHELEGAKAATGIDNRGRVIVVVSNNLPRHWQAAYTLWGLFQYIKLKLT